MNCIKRLKKTLLNWRINLYPDRGTIKLLSIILPIVILFFAVISSRKISDIIYVFVMSIFNAFVELFEELFIFMVTFFDSKILFSMSKLFF